MIYLIIVQIENFGTFLTFGFMCLNIGARHHQFLIKIQELLREKGFAEK